MTSPHLHAFGAALPAFGGEAGELERVRRGVRDLASGEVLEDRALETFGHDARGERRLARLAVERFQLDALGECHAVIVLSGSVPESLGLRAGQSLSTGAACVPASSVS